MGLHLFLVLAGAATVFGDGLQVADVKEEEGIVTLGSQDEIPEELSLRADCLMTGTCRRKKGKCIGTEDTCNGRKERGCKGNCTCCVEERGRCEAKSSCKDANGFCMKKTGNCPGYTIEGGCTGSDCICCVNDNNCLNGFHRVGTECFKIFEKFASWDDARQMCKEHHWQLAEPEDPTALASFIHNNINVQYYFWIGGRGVGESFKYISGQTIQDDAPWGQYGGTSLEDCLAMGSTSSVYNTTLGSFDCSHKYYFICEPACPEGFLRIESSCYKVISQSRSWENAELNCYEDGLTLAEPEDPKGLAEILYKGVGGTRYTSQYWLGARGGRINGSIIAWNSGDAVPVPYPNNSTWRSGYPRHFTRSYCINLYTSYYNSGPGPLYEDYCTYSRYSLCEMICPLGFFHVGNQCYKAYSTRASSWDEAHEICQQAHLSLTQPEDPITLANFLFITTGDLNYWLGGRGDGSMFRWSSGSAIPSNWTAWHAGNPGSKVGTDYCLRLVPEHRTTPLTSSPCSMALYPLCQ